MKTILVPTDFSKLSKAAALYAAGLAKAIKAEVQIVSVVDLDSSSQTLVNWRKLQRQLEQSAEQEAARLMGELKKTVEGVRFSYKTLLGFPIEEQIVQFGQKIKADLIVMGTKGATGLKRVILGSNTAALINVSNIPVIAVPGAVVYKPLQRIVLATDMEGLDMEAKLVARFAKPFGAHIDILYVTNQERKTQRRRELGSILVRMTGHKKLHVEVIKGDNINKSLNKFALENKADLLVMFTHELDLFERVFGKGVTRQMAFHSNVPLLAYKKADLRD